MKDVCISLESLYNKFGENLTYGLIEKTYQEETDTEYFDFFNDKYGLVCMDGESVSIISDEGNYFKLLNTNGEIDTIFELSKEEFEIANYN